MALQESVPIHVSACALPPMPRSPVRMTLYREQASNAEVARSGQHPIRIARYYPPPTLSTS
jgi:hypothetical protein